MGNLLSLLNDKSPVPKVDFYVDFERKFANLPLLLHVGILREMCIYILTVGSLSVKHPWLGLME